MTGPTARSLATGTADLQGAAASCVPLALGPVRPHLASAACAQPADPADGKISAPPWPREPIRSLLASLERLGVRYCHWKSNIRLESSLAGTGDLDLLVDRRHALQFQSALVENGFKCAVCAGGSGHPGVFHAFALDPDSARLLHVHAYFQIVTGDSLVKSYHFPFEETLLAHTRRRHGVPVPSAESELIIFTLRIALKHTSIAEMVLVRRYYDAVVEEMRWARAAADPEAAEALWKSWFPLVPVGIFHDLMAAIEQRHTLVRRVVLGHRLARHLRSWRRIGWGAAVLSRWRRLFSLALVRIGRRRGLVPQAAGLIIAIVGPKATGKTTLSKAAARRLGQHFHVVRVHVGKPPATVMSLLPRLALPLARWLVPGERSSEYDAEERRRDKTYSLLHVLRLSVLAHDRRRLLRRCWRLAASGAIVIADRYPSASIGASDSSRFDGATLAQCRSWPKRWLMERERALYAGLPVPALVIRLKAPIETTVRRDAERDKKDPPNRAAVERRRQMETETDFPDVQVISVDTDQALEDSLKKVMHAIWAAI